jgi:hypothetical protein
MPAPNPTFHEIPSVDNSKSILDTMVRFANPANAPAFIINHFDPIPVDRVIPSIGANVINTGRSYLDWSYDLQHWQEGIDETMFTPEHVDGAQAGSFVMMNTPIDGPDAEFIFRKRLLNPAAQSELRDHLASGDKIYDYDVQAIVGEMPASVKFAPIMAEYRARLRRGMTIVFRNGYPGSSVSEQDRVLTTHEVSSVNEQGVRVNESRHAAVGYIASRKTIIPPRQMPATLSKRLGLFKRSR